MCQIQIELKIFLPADDFKTKSEISLILMSEIESYRISIKQSYSYGWRHIGDVANSTTNIYYSCTVKHTSS